MITKQEEQAYRLRHHEFEGLTEEKTAKIMNVSKRTVKRLLKNLKQKAPQLFPILTRQQYLIYQWYVERGLSQENIAALLGTTQQNVDRILQRMKDNGMPGIDLTSKMNITRIKRFIPEMENHIKQKF